MIFSFLQLFALKFTIQHCKLNEEFFFKTVLTEADIEHRKVQCRSF